MPNTYYQQSNLEALIRRYQQLSVSKDCSQILDLDLKLKNRGDFEIYRLEEFLPKLNGYLPPARQGFFSFLFISTGTGEKRVGQHQYEIKENTLYIIPRRAIHSGTFSRCTSGFLLNFNLELFSKYAIPQQLILGRKIFQNAVHPFTHLKKKQREQMVAIFAEILQLFQCQLSSAMEHAAIKMLELLILCDQLSQHSLNHTASVTGHPIVEKFAHLIDVRFREEKGVQYYAQELCVHPNYLNFLLKKHTGLNAKESIVERIIIEAKYLLSTPGLIIKEVAYKLGFDDPNNFSTFFQKQCGSSPAAYRSKNIWSATANRGNAGLHLKASAA